jgi:hypothetical protein
MSGKLPHWLTNTFYKYSTNITSPTELAQFEECVTLLPSMIDGQASRHEQHYFLNHVYQWPGLQQHYHNEKDMRHFFSNQISTMSAPVSLISTVSTIPE